MARGTHQRILGGAVALRQQLGFLRRDLVGAEAQRERRRPCPLHIEGRVPSRPLGRPPRSPRLGPLRRSRQLRAPGFLVGAVVRTVLCLSTSRWMGDCGRQRVSRKTQAGWDRSVGVGRDSYQDPHHRRLLVVDGSASTERSGCVSNRGVLEEKGLCSRVIELRQRQAIGPCPVSHSGHPGLVLNRPHA